MRASQISKMARVYRLRGTAVRALRALILLEFFQRFAARDPAVRIDRMEKQLEEVELQAKILCRRIGFLRNHLREEELKAEKEKNRIEIRAEAPTNVGKELASELK